MYTYKNKKDFEAWLNEKSKNYIYKPAVYSEIENFISINGVIEGIEYYVLNGYETKSRT